jgi:hypothetical protein
MKNEGSETSHEDKILSLCGHALFLLVWPVLGTALRI